MSADRTTPIPRATGLLVIEVCNSNPNGDPDQESDPRRRSHDSRGMITGVSFKRKLRDLVLRKDEVVWPVVAEELCISHQNGIWTRDGMRFDILERRGLSRGEVDRMLRDDFSAFKAEYWDARVFGADRSAIHRFELGRSSARLVETIPVRLRKTRPTP